MSTMLYERWQRTLTRHGSNWALANDGQMLSFAHLQEQVDACRRSDSIRIVHANGVRFIVEMLAAWRDGAVFIPHEQGQPAPTVPITVPDCACHIKFTSGSTGAPRGIAFRGEQLLADVDQIVATMGLRSEWPNIGVISLAHSYGFSNLVLPLVIHGIPLVLAADVLPGSVQTAMAPYENVSIAAVPAMWRAWLGAGILDRRVRLAISAGAPLAVSLETQIWKQTGIKIHNFYGSSECGGIAYDCSAEPRLDDSVAGTPLEGVHLKVQDGCLEVHSAAVAEGYLESQSNDVLGRGRFRTQDLAQLDASGEVRLLGRLGESINVAGRKVAPQVIENALLTHPDVKHAVVFGVPSDDRERVEEIVAVMRSKTLELPKDLLLHLSRHLPAGHQPRHWWVCEDLQPDHRGKISRAQWKQRFLQKRDSD